MRREPIFRRQINALPIQHRRQLLDVAFGKISGLNIPDVAVAVVTSINEFLERVGFIVASQRATFQRRRGGFSKGAADRSLLLHYRRRRTRPQPEGMDTASPPEDRGHTR